MIFMTLTFSSSIPLLYAIMMFYAFIQYWVDKILLLRFYRKDNSYSYALGRTMVSMLPLALFLHMAFGFMMFSYPQLLKSPVVEGYFGNYSQYFNPDRLGQLHMIVYFSGSVLTLLVLIFEDAVSKVFGACGKCCNRCCVKMKA